jgi:hypothetical protein
MGDRSCLNCRLLEMEIKKYDKVTAEYRYTCPFEDYYRSLPTRLDFCVNHLFEGEDDE